MTWITGGICFNGCACLGDVQATIIFNDGLKRHFNCLQKVHKIYDNLIIAFSGDVRLGLLFIRQLQDDLESCLRQRDHYFDLDGETANFETFCKKFYSIYKKADVPLDILLYWTARDDGEVEWKFYGCKFSAPEFKRKGVGTFQDALQSGSGIATEHANTVKNLVSGNVDMIPDDLKVFFNISGRTKDTLYVFTCKKIIKLLIDVYAKASIQGVSKSTFGYTIEMNKPKHSDDGSDYFNALRELGVWENVKYDGGKEIVHHVYLKFIEILKSSAGWIYFSRQNGYFAKDRKSFSF